jgi:3-oxoacyl-(acyl-carrier-protein) synthase
MVEGKDFPCGLIHDFDCNKHWKKQALSKGCPSFAYGMEASIEARDDSGWFPVSEYEQFESGVCMGNGMVGGVQMQHNTKKIGEKGILRSDKNTLFKVIKNATASGIGIYFKHHGLFNCCEFDNNSGLLSLGEGFLSVVDDDANVIICGTSDYISWDFYTWAAKCHDIYTK